MPILLDDAIDWEMGIYGTHFVSESLLYPQIVQLWYAYVFPHLGHSNDHVVDQTANCSKASDVLPAALPNSQSDLRCLPFQDSDIHVDMSDVLGQGTTRTSNSDETGFYCNFNAGRNVEFFCFDNVPHLKK